MVSTPNHLVDSGFKRNTRPKEIVVETFTDKSGQVRKARVRTATGTISLGLHNVIDDDDRNEMLN